MDFYAARDNKVGQETMAKFGVDKVPALVVLDGDKVNKYDGTFFKPCRVSNAVRRAGRVSEESVNPQVR